MLTIRRNALLRALSTCANFMQPKRRIKPTKGTTLPPMTDHIARDIGLTPHQRALLSHRWPSRESRHPYL